MKPGGIESNQGGPNNPPVTGIESLINNQRSEKVDYTKFKGETNEGFIKKTILLQGRYDEDRSFFDEIPDEISAPKDPVEIKYDKNTTEEEMKKGHQFYSKIDAFALACKYKFEDRDAIQNEGVLFWFKDNDVPCHIHVGFNGRRTEVSRSNDKKEWGENIVSCFRE